MMKTILRFLIISALCTSAYTQSRPDQTVEQTTFNLGGVEDHVVQHPVVLTDPELAALAKDELMQKELDRKPPISKLTREGLEAAVVHLHGSQERDLVVVGSGRPFIGANVGPFWIIRDLPDGPQVVLSTIALSLEIQKSSFNSYRNIEALAATAVTGTTTSFRFDGKRYATYRGKSTNLGAG
jgi:hypothetical protein